MLLKITDSDITRFWAKVNKRGRRMPHMTTRCWEWTASLDSKGYGQLRIGGRPNGGLCRAHRLGWYIKHKIWPTPNALHKCDNRKCSRWSHLFQGTRADNAKDMVAKLRHNFGERSPTAKLSEKTVASIRRKYATGNFTQKELAELYKAEPSRISRIVTGDQWKHSYRAS